MEIPPSVKNIEKLTIGATAVALSMHNMVNAEIVLNPDPGNSGNIYLTLDEDATSSSNNIFLLNGSLVKDVDAEHTKLYLVASAASQVIYYMLSEYQPSKRKIQ